MRRRRILISAFACRPGMGSEPGTGWACATMMAAHCDVWVITRGQNRDVIEEEMSRHPIAGLHFVYVDLPRWIPGLRKPRQEFQLLYYFWQLAAYFEAKRLCAAFDIDLIHHVTYQKFWAPSFVALLPVPFVWGPVGGGETMPPGFLRRCELRGRLYETARWCARSMGECDPFVRLTARRSSTALASTHESADRIRMIGGRNTEVYSAIGITQEDLDVLDGVPGAEGETVRFLSIGRMLHWKGFDLGLTAFARAGLEGAEYWLIGDGPERPRLEALAAELGIAANTRFHGEITRARTLELLGQSDVLLHPSLHESGGLVCLEAMAARRPVVCLDWGGPALQVDEETGIRIAVDDPDQVIDDLAEAMSRSRDGRRSFARPWVTPDDGASRLTISGRARSSATARSTTTCWRRPIAARCRPRPEPAT